MLVDDESSGNSQGCNAKCAVKDEVSHILAVQMASPGRILLDFRPEFWGSLAFVILEFFFEKLVNMLTHNYLFSIFLIFS